MKINRTMGRAAGLIAAIATLGFGIPLFAPSTAQANPFDGVRRAVRDAIANATAYVADITDDTVVLTAMPPVAPGGWVIDTDRDDDGRRDAEDNCREIPNDDQANLDNDEKGDVCDEDIDGDGIANDADTCRLVANPDQADLDADGEGDVCDEDIDGDGIADDADNCGAVANTDQADQDGDGTGDACDDTPSGDASGAGDGSSPEDGAASGGNNTPSGFGLMADEGGCSMVPSTGSPWGFLIIAGGVLLLAFRRKRGCSFPMTSLLAAVVFFTTACGESTGSNNIPQGDFETGRCQGIDCADTGGGGLDWEAPSDDGDPDDADTAEADPDDADVPRTARKTIADRDDEEEPLEIKFVGKRKLECHRFAPCDIKLRAKGGSGSYEWSLLEPPDGLNDLVLEPSDDTERATATARPAQVGESSFTVKLTDTASGESTTKEIPVDTEFNAARFWAPITDATATSAEAGADACDTELKINEIPTITLKVGNEIEVAQPVPITVNGGKGPFTFDVETSNEDRQDSEYVGSSLIFISCDHEQGTCEAMATGGIIKKRAHLSALRKEIKENEPRNTYIVTVTDEGCSGTQAKAYVAIEYKVDDEIVFDEGEVTSRIRVWANDTGSQSTLDALFLNRAGGVPMAKWLRELPLEYDGGEMGEPMTFSDLEIGPVGDGGVTDGGGNQIDIANFNYVRFIMNDPGSGEDMDTRIYWFTIRAGSWCASPKKINEDERGYYENSCGGFCREEFRLFWWLCGDEKEKPAPARPGDGGGADGGCAKGAAAGAAVSPMLAGPGCAVGALASAIF